MTIQFVNFLQFGLLTLTLFAIALTWHQRAYRMLQGLFALVAISMLFNLLEEVGSLRQYHLVTPIFLLAMGPAIYLSIRQLTGKPINLLSALHFVPMLLALPFTQHSQWVIAVGTLSRLIYSGFSLNLIRLFHRKLQSYRSDAEEFSLNWLGWLVGAFALIGILDLIRLNLQPYISHTTNVLGQTADTGLTLLLFSILIYQAQKYSQQLMHLFDESCQLQVESPPKPLQTEDTDTYKVIFEALEAQLIRERWYRQPRLNLNQLSQLSGLQSRDISRAVNLCTGLNFNDYINRLRVEDVKQAIAGNQQQNLLTLALDAGFNAKSSFNTAFKKHQGMTPSQYKNSLEP
ncbi:helix-turn-helix domain-containing protein [Aliiglaciecola sp. CAU 1673]|uniref:helix-turn-helix domain-containing protein n=1 Tax=Aliiglaciecola sp. CAU 1673 TaxID=3032595 RepID=UPI0023DBD360|nr:helix-turn-helix domain-containing protein [Aliiglaciecola sp. CAU 1673]MDF2176917.1 helix-turn-helix domain-containing protein [Aliiglaciecola sp. CAU 1673]